MKRVDYRPKRSKYDTGTVSADDYERSPDFYDQRANERRARRVDNRGANL